MPVIRPMRRFWRKSFSNPLKRLSKFAEPLRESDKKYFARPAERGPAMIMAAIPAVTEEAKLFIIVKN